MSQKIEQKFLDLAGRYSYHKRSCALDRTDNDEGDYCTCGLRERRDALAVDIQNLVRNSNG